MRIRYSTFVRTGLLSVAMLMLLLTTAFAQERLVIGLNSEPFSLDGQETLSAPNLVILPHIYDKLLEFDENMELTPQLATSWSVSEDGLTWTFHLREGVTFHDGTPLNAESVKFSFDRLLAGSRFRTTFIKIAEVTAVDEHTVQFTTDGRFLFLPQLMTYPGAGIASPTAIQTMSQEEFYSNPVGSGPYRFVEWERGNRIVLERNPDHWLADQGNIDEIEFRFIPDEATRSIALETGEIDFATNMVPSTAHRLASDPNFVVYGVPQNRVEGLYVNTYRPPFSDIRVRYAIAHAIDKELMVDVFGEGFATVADSPIAAGVWGYKPQEVFEFNPDRARELLAEAGYPDGFESSLWLRGDNVQANQKAQAVGAMLADVGITVDIQAIDAGRYFELLNVEPEDSTLDMIFRIFSTWTGDPNYGLRLLFHTANWAPVGPNRNFYANEEVDRLLDLGPTLIDDDERRAAYERVQEIVWTDQPWVLISFNQVVFIGRSNVKGFQPLQSNTAHFRFAHIE